MATLCKGKETVRAWISQRPSVNRLWDFPKTSPSCVFFVQVVSVEPRDISFDIKFGRLVLNKEPHNVLQSKFHKVREQLQQEMQAMKSCSMCKTTKQGTNGNGTCLQLANTCTSTSLVFPGPICSRFHWTFWRAGA